MYHHPIRWVWHRRSLYVVYTITIVAHVPQQTADLHKPRTLLAVSKRKVMCQSFTGPIAEHAMLLVYPCAYQLFLCVSFIHRELVGVWSAAVVSN